MKNRIRKLLSCLIAAVLLCGAFVPCLAMAAGESVPIVYVPGFMSTDLYLDTTDPDKGLAWPPATEDILNVMKGAVPALARYAVDRNADKLCDAVIPLVNAMFDAVELDAEGNPKGNTGVIFSYPPEEMVKKGGVYIFHYDWRIDPLEIASQLNEFVEYIRQSAGSDKVSIQCHSLGGVITLTYLTRYGLEKVKNVVFNSTAIFGESFNGGLLSGEMKLSGDAIVKYMRYAFNSVDAKALLNGIFEILGKAGLLDLISDRGNKLLEDLSPRAVPESVAPLFAGWLTIWSMIPDEFIDGAMKYIFEDVWPDGSHDGLKAKIEAFNAEIRPHKTEKLLALNEAANVFVIARYGWSSIPVTPYYKNQSDGTIDLKYASFGATAADYGETLSDEYLAGADAAFISPDKSIDASTCLFPEQTWFVRNLPHSEHNQGIDALVDTLVRAEGQETVASLSGYSRFMVSEGGGLTADPGVPAKQTLLDRIKAFFQKIIDFFRNLFKR